jgi:hypothetical protein
MSIGMAIVSGDMSRGRTELVDGQEGEEMGEKAGLLGRLIVDDVGHRRERRAKAGSECD